MAGKAYICAMKNLILTIICLGISTMSNAQFNTIARSPSLYKVKRIEQELPKDSVISNTPNDSTPPATIVADDVQKAVFTKGKTVELGVEELDSMKTELLRQYLSVAYPLSHIKVTSPYGMRKHPVMRKWIMHEGIDLRARYEEVYSVMDGEVIAVSSNKRSGQYIIIRYPGGYTCSYCHLSRPLVKKGNRVRAGEVIAVSGNTGMSTSSHLHFGVRGASGERINPLVLLEFIRKTREEVTQKLQALNCGVPKAA